MRTSEMRPCDAAEVRREFRASLTPSRAEILGIPMPEVLDAYEALWLDWFVDEQSPSVVGVLHDDQHVLCGFALVCVAPSAFTSWRQAALVRHLRRVTPLLLGRPTGETARFILLRALDQVAPRRRSFAASTHTPHARLFLTPRTPRLAGMHLLTAFVDDTCRAAGFDRWIGQIQGAPTQLETMSELGLGTAGVDQTMNPTVSWLRGETVDQLTFTRCVTEHLAARAS